LYNDDDDDDDNNNNKYIYISAEHFWYIFLLGWLTSVMGGS